MQLTEEIVQEVSKAVAGNSEQEETLDELIQRIKEEHSEQNTSEQSSSTELKQSNLGSLTWLANRIAKVFEDQRPIDENGNRLDRKMYTRQETSYEKSRLN